jgi:hypothetical protein
VAARAQPYSRYRAVITGLATVIALVALGRPEDASAHSGTVVNALDYRATITFAGRRGLVHAQVIDSDRKLELEVAPAATVVVLGYGHEPFLRFSSTGVEVNERSETAVADRLAGSGAVPVLDPHATPAWSRISRGHRYAWHDHRLGPTPGRAYATGDVGGWRIPLVVAGHPDAVSGRLLHKRGPAAWPWLALFVATATLASALVVARGRRRLVESVSYVAAAVGGLAAALLAISFGFVAGRPAVSAWATVVFCCIVGAVAIALFVGAPRARYGVATFIGILAALLGLSDLSVLTHGFVISTLPAAAVRALVAAACSAGAVAATAAATLLLWGGDRIAARTRSPRMAIPRGRP